MFVVEDPPSGLESKPCQVKNITEVYVNVEFKEQSISWMFRIKILVRVVNTIHVFPFIRKFF